jgi:hypothetical protein
MNDTLMMSYEALYSLDTSKSVTKTKRPVKISAMHAIQICFVFGIVYSFHMELVQIPRDGAPKSRRGLVLIINRRAWNVLKHPETTRDHH